MLYDFSVTGVLTRAVFLKPQFVLMFLEHCSSENLVHCQTCTSITALSWKRPDTLLDKCPQTPKGPRQHWPRNMKHQPQFRLRGWTKTSFWLFQLYDFTSLTRFPGSSASSTLSFTPFLLPPPPSLPHFLQPLDFASQQCSMTADSQ